MRLLLSLTTWAFVVLKSNRVSADLSSPPVTISLKTPWSAPSLVLEILELLPRFSTNSYFPFLEQLFTFPSDSQEKGLSSFVDWKPEEAYNNSLSLIFNPEGGFLESSSRPLFEFYLSVHSSAPAVQAYYHYYDSYVLPELNATPSFDPQCSNWLHVGKNYYCGLPSIVEAISNLNTTVSQER